MIRDLTGNQWRDLMTGVMWSFFLVCVTCRAALFWRSCRRWMSLSDKPKSNGLQLSNLEVTKEWTSCSVARGVRNLTIFPIMWIWLPHGLNEFRGFLSQFSTNFHEFLHTIFPIHVVTTLKVSRSFDKYCRC